MDLEKEFGFDERKAEEGVWIPIGDDGAELLIAAMPNKKYDAFLNPRRRNYRQIDQEIPEAIYEEAVARTVLLGWKKLELGGKELEPTEANRKEALNKYPYFKALVVKLATNRANFLKAEEEKETKNSKTGPRGTSGSVRSLPS